jgi:hypothetical protein
LFCFTLGFYHHDSSPLNTGSINSASNSVDHMFVVDMSTTADTNTSVPISTANAQAAATTSEPAAQNISIATPMAMLSSTPSFGATPKSSSSILYTTTAKYDAAGSTPSSATTYTSPSLNNNSTAIVPFTLDNSTAIVPFTLDEKNTKRKLGGKKSIKKPAKASNVVKYMTRSATKQGSTTKKGEFKEEIDCPDIDDL